MPKATEPDWTAADDDFARDVEAVGVECVDCGEWVYVTSAEYDRATESWICWTCLYGHDEDDGEVS